MKKVEEIMTSDVITVSPGTTPRSFSPTTVSVDFPSWTTRAPSSAS